MTTDSSSTRATIYDSFTVSGGSSVSTVGTEFASMFQWLYSNEHMTFNTAGITNTAIDTFKIDFISSTQQHLQTNLVGQADFWTVLAQDKQLLAASYQFMVQLDDCANQAYTRAESGTKSVIVDGSNGGLQKVFDPMEAIALFSLNYTTSCGPSNV